MITEPRGRCLERRGARGSCARAAEPARRSPASRALCAWLLGLGAVAAGASPAAALEIFTSAETNAGFASDQQWGNEPVAIASASHSSGVTSYAEFRVDPDDQDIELQFSITPGPGGFDSTVLASAFARGHAGYVTDLSAGPSSSCSR